MITATDPAVLHPLTYAHLQSEDDDVTTTTLDPNRDPAGYPSGRSTADTTPAGSRTARRAPTPWRAAWTIALRELTDHITSARFLGIAALVLGLTPLVTYVGASDYQTRLGEYSRLEAERQELAAGPAGEEVTGRATQSQLTLLRAIRRPEPLSALVRGLDAALPVYWEFSTTGIEAGPSAYRPERLADLLGQLDLEFLVRVVLGLLAILLAFDAVAGEKELGTLRAVLSQPISRPSFLAGKLIGGAITLLVPLILAVLLALLSARLFGADLLAAEPLAKIALLTATAALYLVCLYALGLLVSSLAASQKTSLVALLVVWVVTVLAVPSIATLVAQAVAPVPPAHAIKVRKRALDDDIRKDSERALGVVYREEAGIEEGWAGSRWYEDNKEAIDRRAAPIIRDYLAERRRLLGEIDSDLERITARQHAFARAIMALSPAAAFANAASTLAGTGDAAQLGWTRATQRHQGRLGEVLFEDPPTFIMDNGGASFLATLRKPPTVGELPAFAPPRSDAAATLVAGIPTLGLLLLYTALFVTGAFIAFARYDVR